MVIVKDIQVIRSFIVLHIALCSILLLKINPGVGVDFFLIKTRIMEVTNHFTILRSAAFQVLATHRDSLPLLIPLNFSH